MQIVSSLSQEYPYQNQEYVWICKQPSRVMFVILHKRWQRRKKWKIKAEASTMNMNISWRGSDNGAFTLSGLRVQLCVSLSGLSKTLTPRFSKGFILLWSRKSGSFDDTFFPQDLADLVRIHKWQMFIHHEHLFWIWEDKEEWDEESSQQETCV